MSGQNPKTREEVISAFGEPKSETTNSEAFFANSFQEDCFLMGGGRNCFDKRSVFSGDTKSIIVYFDVDGNVIKMFYKYNLFLS